MTSAPHVLIAQLKEISMPHRVFSRSVVATTVLLISVGVPAQAASSDSAAQRAPVITATRLPGTASNFVAFAVGSPNPVEISKVTPDGELLGESWGVLDLNPDGSVKQNWQRRSFIWRDGKVSYLTGPDAGAPTLGIDMNHRGRVVGAERPDGNPTPLTWAPGASLGQALPSAVQGSAVAVNDQGEFAQRVTGTATIQVHSANGAVSTITAPEGMTGLSTTSGLGFGLDTTGRPLNNRGQLLLWATDSSNRLRPLIWRNGAFTDLGVLHDLPAGNTGTIPSAINEAGQVIGNDEFGAWIWTAGRLRRLANLPGVVPSENSRSAQAIAINGTGLVVGHADDENPDDGKSHAVYWDATGIHRLPELTDTASGPAAVSEALAVNNRGQIVGWSGGHAVLWDHGRLIDLGQPEGTAPSSSKARLISENGTIFGTAGVPDDNLGNPYHFVMYGYQWKAAR
jgi:uncharacterized membrane protein